MSNPILVTGTIDFDPAHRDAVIEAAKTVMAVTAKEAGCEQYVMSADLNEAGRLHISERWTDAESLAAHSKAEHLRDFGRALRAGGVKGTSIMRWDGATGQKLG